MVVREPAERLFSAYTDKIANKQNILFHRPGLSFAAWVSELYDTKELSHDWDEHWRPQVNFVPIGAKLINLRTFERDMAQVLRWVGMLPPPEWRNPKKSKATLWATNETHRMIHRIYNDDYHLHHFNSL